MPRTTEFDAVPVGGDDGGYEFTTDVFGGNVKKCIQKNTKKKKGGKKTSHADGHVGHRSVTVVRSSLYNNIIIMQCVLAGSDSQFRN